MEGLGSRRQQRIVHPELLLSDIMALGNSLTSALLTNVVTTVR